MTRLNINIKEGTLEVEGEETFVAGVYADFKEQLAIAGITTRTAPTVTLSPGASETPTPKLSRKSRAGSKTESFTILKDLDLSAKGNTKSLSLRDFYVTKKPSNAMESNAVFVYFLQMVVGIKAITLDHIYSCYKNVDAKIPALRQSVANAVFHKGYLDTTSYDAIKIAIPGENFVEQDLPRKAK